MNKIILIGRLTKDPELRNTNSGMEVVSFTVAISRTFKNKDGQYDTDFLNVSLFGRQAGNVQKYCFKGSQVAVEGRVQTRSYDAQDGTKRYVTEVIADNVEFLGSKRDGGNGGQIDAPYQPDIDYIPNQPEPVNNVDVSNEDPFKDYGSDVTLSDDDLPF